MPRSAIVTLRLQLKLKKKLDDLSSAMSRSRSFVATEAIRDYIALNEWQISEIKKAVNEADRGEFASEKDVEKVFRKWTRRAD